MNLYSIDSVAARDRLDYWHDLVCTYPLDPHTTLVSPQGTISKGKMGISDFTRLKLMQVATSSYTVKRGRPAVSRANEEFAELVYQRKGTAVFQQGSRTVEMRPGQFTLYDSAAPSILEVSDDYEHLIARFPRAQFIQKIPRLDKLYARAFNATNGVGRVLVQLLDLLAKEDANNCSESTWHIIDAILDSTAAVTCLAFPQDVEEMSSSKQALLQRVKLYIENNLTQETLTSSAIANQHGISIRYLNTLLEQEGTSITRWIRQRRLERCANDLILPSNAHRSIGEIAYGWGFNSLSYFNREFKNCYELTPREYRAAHLLLLSQDKP